LATSEHFRSEQDREERKIRRACEALADGLPQAVGRAAWQPRVVAAFENFMAVPGRWAVAYERGGKEFRRLAGELADPPFRNQLSAGLANSLAWYFCTTAEDEHRDAQLAVVLARLAVEQSPGDGRFVNTLGVALYRSGAWDDARMRLEESLDLQGENPIDLFFLAMVHERLADSGKARELYERAVEVMQVQNPDNAELVRFRAEVEAVLGAR
jgi:tetratricopeptide (TPR) repeat protein